MSCSEQFALAPTAGPLISRQQGEEMQQILARLALLAWVGVAGIVVLSLVPGYLRPHTSLPGPVEHAIAYALVGITFALTYRGKGKLVAAAVGLCILAFTMEALQNFVPGRSPAVWDAVMSTFGASFGLAVGAPLRYLSA